MSVVPLLSCLTYMLFQYVNQHIAKCYILVLDIDKDFQFAVITIQKLFIKCISTNAFLVSARIVLEGRTSSLSKNNARIAII